MAARLPADFGQTSKIPEELVKFEDSQEILNFKKLYEKKHLLPLGYEVQFYIVTEIYNRLANFPLRTDFNATW